MLDGRFAGQQRSLTREWWPSNATSAREGANLMLDDYFPLLVYALLAIAIPGAR